MSDRLIDSSIVPFTSFSASAMSATAWSSRRVWVASCFISCAWSFASFLCLSSFVIPSIFASERFASTDSSFSSGDVDRRSSSAPASIAADVAAATSRWVAASRVVATSCSRISRSASDIWWVRISASATSARSLAEVISVSSSRTRSSAVISFSV